MRPRRIVSLGLPPDLLESADRAARLADCSLAEFIRDAIAAALTPDRRGIGSDQPILDRVRAAFAQAPDWLTLQSTLRSNGFVLRASPAGGLALHAWPSDRRLMPVEALGYGPAALCLRFRSPFPGVAGPAARSADAA